MARLVRCASWRRGRGLPTSLAAGMDGDPSRDKLCEQLGNSGGSFTISGYDYSPFQIFSKRFGANFPLAERQRFLLSNVNDGPMPCEGDGRLFIWQRPAQDEVVVPMHQDANHFVSSLQAQVSRATARGVFFRVRWSACAGRGSAC